MPTCSPGHTAAGRCDGRPLGPRLRPRACRAPPGRRWASPCRHPVPPPMPTTRNRGFHADAGHALPTRALAHTVHKWWPHGHTGGLAALAPTATGPALPVLAQACAPPKLARPKVLLGHCVGPSPWRAKCAQCLIDVTTTRLHTHVVQWCGCRLLARLSRALHGNGVHHVLTT